MRATCTRCGEYGWMANDDRLLCHKCNPVICTRCVIFLPPGDHHLDELGALRDPEGNPLPDVQVADGCIHFWADNANYLLTRLKEYLNA